MFDWQLLQDDNLIEKYDNIELLNDILYANDDLFFDYKNKVLHKNNHDIKIKIDFHNNRLFIIMNDNTLETDIYYISNKEDDNRINIDYQIAENEPIYTLIITRKE